MPREASWRKTYLKTVVDQLIPKLKGTDPMTVIGPSGFGKTSLLRYLTYNRKYRSRYKHLNKIEFVYVDVMKLISESEVEVPTNPIVMHKVSEIFVLKKMFVEGMYKKLEKHPLEKPNEENIDTLLTAALKDFKAVYRNNHIYFIIDECDYLLSKNPAAFSSFIRSFRDQNRGQVEYIFSNTNIDWLKINAENVPSGFKNLLTRQIFIVPLIPSIDTHNFNSSGLRRFYDENITRRTKKYKEYVDKIYEISGGFLPYSKYLYSLDKLPEKILITLELRLLTENFLENLNEEQIRIIKTVLNNPEASLPNTYDLIFLTESKIIRFINQKWRLFSPILETHLKSIP